MKGLCSHIADVIGQAKNGGIKMIYLNCIRRAPNGSIAVVGGIDSATDTQKHYTEAMAIAAINSGTEAFVVRDGSGHQASVRVAHHGGHYFLETHRDGVKTDNLDHLPACHHNAHSPVPQPHRPTPVHRGHAVGADWLKK
jgi:hypothetical protein